MGALRFLIAIAVCLIALILPYRLRLLWFGLVASLVHLPFLLFGRLARYLLSASETPNPFYRKDG
jgi:hypothetical protein